MNPIDRMRLEKAGTDSGFELTPTILEDGLELASALFDERVRVRMAGTLMFEVSPASAVHAAGPLEAGPLLVRGIDELYALLRRVSSYARNSPTKLLTALASTANQLPLQTEVERLSVQRVGQSLFRGALLDYWGGKCCVTALDVPELLRASHIRPWADCESDAQRLDVFNGLLLAPHLDALFDRGYATVSEDGEWVMSRRLSASQIRALGIPASPRVHGLGAGHHVYLAHHRAKVWRE